MRIQMNKCLTNVQIKEKVIKVLKHYQSTIDKKISFPIPIKAIAKSFKNIRVIPYSIHMREYNISYKNMILQCETDDAYTDYDFHKDLYIIYYNDIDVTKTKSNRYRWNIAHELGHIVLDHNLNSENTKLFRNKLDDYEYTILEKEADSFASYLNPQNKPSKKPTQRA
jgi:Zn-dependent peptidase ImmA (M78 family)